MYGLLDGFEKQDLICQFNEFTETYTVPILVWREAQKLVIATNPNFNRFQQNDQNDLGNPVNVPQQFTVQARIYYAENQGAPFQRFVGAGGGGSEESQIKIRDPDGMVRIKVDFSGYQILNGAKQVEINGLLFNPDSTERVFGLFGSGEYYSFQYSRIR